MADALTAPPAHAPPSPPGVARVPGWQSRTFLLLACLVACAAFWWVGGALGIAREHGFNGSLLASPGAAGDVVATGVLIGATVAVGTLLAGFVRPDAGLFAAAVGLTALSARGQPVYAVLQDAASQDAGGRGVFLVLAAELLALYAWLGAAAWLLGSLQRRGRLQPDPVRDGLDDVDLPAHAGWGTLLTHVLLMATAVLLIAQSEDKKQVLAAVAVGSFAGAFFPYWQHGARPSVWYWTGPLVVGLAGYLLAYFDPPPGLDIGRPGHPAGVLAALVRPLPLDYASLGTAGGLLGYWMRRRSLRDRQMARHPS